MKDFKKDGIKKDRSLEEIKKHYGNCGEVEICRFRYLIEKED
jgi:hypothetical protein